MFKSTSRVGRKPVSIPSSIAVDITEDNLLVVRGPCGELKKYLHKSVDVKIGSGEIIVSPSDKSRNSNMQCGTARALINNMVIGVSHGFRKILYLTGVGYRAKVEGDVLNLALGFSHPVCYHLPREVSAETPSQTEIVLNSSDKEILGKTASEIRSYRVPEAYKGKGIRYSDERVVTKEAKKK